MYRFSVGGHRGKDIPGGDTGIWHNPCKHLKVLEFSSSVMASDRK